MLQIQYFVCLSGANLGLLNRPIPLCKDRGTRFVTFFGVRRTFLVFGSIESSVRTLLILSLHLFVRNVTLEIGSHITIHEDLLHKVLGVRPTLLDLGLVGNNLRAGFMNLPLCQINVVPVDERSNNPVIFVRCFVVYSRR